MDFDVMYSTFETELLSLAKDVNATAAEVNDILQRGGVGGIDRHKRRNLLLKARRQLADNIFTENEIVGTATNLEDFLSKHVDKDKWQVVKASFWGAEDGLKYSAQLKPIVNVKQMESLAEAIEEYVHFYSNDTYAIEHSDKLLQIDMPDLHFNKRFIEGKDQNREDHYFDIFVQIFESSMNSIGESHADVLLLFFNDMINSEALGSTENGTRQDNANPTHIGFAKAVKFVESAINHVLSHPRVGNIHIPVVLGNHAPQEELRLAEVINIMFRDVARVTIDNANTPRKYYRFGNNLMSYEHGHKTKPERTFINMATERPQDFAECKYKYCFAGHTHKSDVVILKEENSGVNYTRLRSLTEVDYWHAMAGYVGIPGCSSHIFDFDGQILDKKEIFF